MEEKLLWSALTITSLSLLTAVLNIWGVNLHNLVLMLIPFGIGALSIHLAIKYFKVSKMKWGIAALGFILASTLASQLTVKLGDPGAPIVAGLILMLGTSVVHILTSLIK